VKHEWAGRKKRRKGLARKEGQNSNNWLKRESPLENGKQRQETNFGRANRVGGREGGARLLRNVQSNQRRLKGGKNTLAPHCGLEKEARCPAESTNGGTLVHSPRNELSVSQNMDGGGGGGATK